MSDESFFGCGGCGRPVDPDKPDTVAARRQIETTALSGTPRVADGEGLYFHGACYPGDSRWLRRAS